MAKRNSENMLVFVCPVPIFWEADTENSAESRFTDTCLPRCLQLQIESSHYVRKRNVSIISLYCCFTAFKRKEKQSISSGWCGEVLAKVLRVQCLYGVGQERKGSWLMYEMALLFFHKGLRHL